MEFELHVLIEGEPRDLSRYRHQIDGVFIRHVHRASIRDSSSTRAHFLLQRHLRKTLALHIENGGKRCCICIYMSDNVPSTTFRHSEDMKQLVIANAQHVLFVLRYARNEDGIRHGREIRYVCLIHSSSKQLVLLPAIHIVYTNESASLRYGGKQ